MLEAVFGSEGAERVLLFLSARGEGYASEIADTFAMSVSNVQKHLQRMERAELAALVVETLAGASIDVVLVGGSCVCVYTNERFGSLDLDFIDMSYARKKEVPAALVEIGFASHGASRYFEREGCQWSLEFPTAPLAVGHELITSDRVAEMETDAGTLRLLSPTDCVKDRLLWWYLEHDKQCWEQALDIARHQKILWDDLKRWREGEGYADQFDSFHVAVKS